MYIAANFRIPTAQTPTQCEKCVNIFVPFHWVKAALVKPCVYGNSWEKSFCYVITSQKPFSQEFPRKKDYLPTGF